MSIFFAFVASRHRLARLYDTEPNSETVPLHKQIHSEMTLNLVVLSLCLEWGPYGCIWVHVAELVWSTICYQFKQAVILIWIIVASKIRPFVAEFHQCFKGFLIPMDLGEVADFVAFTSEVFLNMNQSYIHRFLFSSCCISSSHMWCTSTDWFMSWLCVWMFCIYSDKEYNEIQHMPLERASKESNSSPLLSRCLFDWMETQVLIEQCRLMEIACRPGLS